MPNGVRSSLMAFILCTGIAASALAAPGTTWTDPPARQPDAPKPAPRAEAPQTPAAVSPPHREEAHAVRRARRAPRREAARHRHVRVAHRPNRPQFAAAPERMPRTVAVVQDRPMVRRYAYPLYSQAGFPPGYEDERLERLGTAVRSGYLVMHRRTVEYPDGRVIRYYRPVEGEDD